MSAGKLVVADLDKRILRDMIARNHYSRTCTMITVGYGVWYDGVLSGGIVFSIGTGKYANKYCPICKPWEIIELTRLWLADYMPKNSESRVIGVALRVLKKGRGRFRAVLSYADETFGHIGTIYQATNFRYMGMSAINDRRVVIGEKVYSARSLNSRFGTSSIRRLRKILGRDDIRILQTGTRKHAYVYPLDDEVAAWLDAHKLPYPKRASVV